MIQQALKLESKGQQRTLYNAVRPFEEELSKSTGGKHILNQLNEMSGRSSGNQGWTKT